MSEKTERELFKLVVPYQPTGDQPEAIARLVEGIKRGDKEQTLLGVTGSGKTFTMANIIQQVQRPSIAYYHVVGQNEPKNVRYNKLLER